MLLINNTQITIFIIIITIIITTIIIIIIVVVVVAVIVGAQLSIPVRNTLMDQSYILN